MVHENERRILRQGYVGADQQNARKSEPSCRRSACVLDISAHEGLTSLKSSGFSVFGNLLVTSPSATTLAAPRRYNRTYTSAEWFCGTYARIPPPNAIRHRRGRCGAAAVRVRSNVNNQLDTFRVYGIPSVLGLVADPHAVVTDHSYRCVATRVRCATVRHRFDIKKFQRMVQVVVGVGAPPGAPRSVPLPLPVMGGVPLQRACPPQPPIAGTTNLNIAILVYICMVDTALFPPAGCPVTEMVSHLVHR